MYCVINNQAEICININLRKIKEISVIVFPVFMSFPPLILPAQNEMFWKNETVVEKFMI